MAEVTTPSLDAPSASRAHSRFDRALLSVLFLLMAGAFHPLFLNSSAGETSSTALQLLFGLGYLVLFVRVPPRWGEVSSVARRNRGLIALTALACLSVAWSAFPEITVRRSVALVITAVVSAHIVSRFDSAEILRSLAASLAFAVAFTFVITRGVASPGTGVEVVGLFLNKNILGKSAALLTITLYVLARDRLVEPRVAIVGILLGGYVLVASQSKTSLVATILIVLLAPTLRLRQVGGPLWLPMIGAFAAASAVVGLWAGIGPADAFSSLGRDSTLSGRTVLWASVVNQIESRPLLGSGYSAFWVDESASAQDLWNDQLWRPTHAHNGVLDIALDLGLVGVAVLAATMSRAIAQARSAALSSTRWIDLWPGLFLALMLTNIATEGILLRPNSLYWVLFMVAAWWHVDRLESAG